MIQNIKRASSKVKVHTKETFQMTHFVIVLLCFCSSKVDAKSEVNGTRKEKQKNKKQA